MRWLPGWIARNDKLLLILVLAALGAMMAWLHSEVCRAIEAVKAAEEQSDGQ